MLVGAAVALAWVLSPAVDWLQARRVPRPIAIVLVLLLVGVITTGLLWVAVPDIVEHLTELVGVIPQRMQQDWLPRITNGLLWLRRRSHLRIPVTTDAWISQLASRASSVAQGSLAVVASAAGLSYVIVEKAIEALVTKRVDVRPLVSEVFSLDEAEAAFACAGRKGVAKVVIDVSRGG
jgi:predicted PurR-regulated permease PerM